ncbi:MAG: DMT family transporter [bacterium]|jgi:drug/metabolite transporter (DMT)-like permease
MKRAFLQLHVAIFLAGFTAVFGRLITLNEALLVWYRMLISTLILLLLAFSKPSKKFLSIRETLHLVFVGGIIALHWVFFYGSIKYANISVALVCLSAMGFFSSLIDPLISRRRIDVIEVLLGLVVMVGIFLIFHFDEVYRIGILFGLVSSFLAAVFPVLNKQLIVKHDADTITLYEIGGGWALLNFIVPVYLFFSPETHLVPNWTDLFWLVVLSLFCTVIAFKLSVSSLTRLSPFTVNLSYNLEPVYGILLAFVIYHEHKTLGNYFYMGLGIIFLTVILETLRVWLKARRV